MASLDDYQGIETAWCPGCGNFGILNAFKEAMVELGIEPHRLAVVSGIGQAGKFPHYIRCNTFNGLMGSISVAPVGTCRSFTARYRCGWRWRYVWRRGESSDSRKRRNIGISVLSKQSDLWANEGQAFHE
jgi:pyruvate/2-oxoacid:ferredoxin oxidoreductase beta subunit